MGRWQTGAALADRRDHHVTFSAVTNAGTFVYVLGGAQDMHVAVSSIERAAIAEDGSLGAWETLPATRQTMGAGVAVAGRLALIAGGDRFGAISPKTDLATIGDDGSLSLAGGPPMLHARFHVGVVRAGNWVYAVGGAQEDATSQASVERASFDEQGIGAWVEDRAMPAPRSHHAVVAYEGALFAIAGLNRYDGDPFPYKDEPFADILRAAILDDGSLGEWKTVGSMPDVLAVHAAFVHLNQIYVVGGLEGAGIAAEFVPLVRRATVAADGTVGPFENLPSMLPLARGHCHQVPLLNGVLYSVGGAKDDGLEMMSQGEAFFARFE
jgi:hypothetical protein